MVQMSIHSHRAGLAGRVPAIRQASRPPRAAHVLTAGRSRSSSSGGSGRYREPRGSRVACTALTADRSTGGSGGWGGGRYGQGGSGGNGGGSGGGGGSSGGRGDFNVPLVAVLSVVAQDLYEAQQAAVRRQQQASRGGNLLLLGLGAVALGKGLAAAIAASKQPPPVEQEGPGEGASCSVAEHSLPTEEAPQPQPSSTAVDPPAAPAASAPAVAALQAAPESSGSDAPKRIVLFIEPSPFTYMSGYQTRFLATIKEMVAAGCQVLVVTPGRGAAGLLPGGAAQPSEFQGARVVEAGSFPCPAYGSVPLSLGLSPRIFNEVRSWRPDLIHVTSPGALPIAAWLYSRMLRVPLVASYHTHVPSYLPKMGLGWLAGGIWGIIKAIHRSAHLTIAVSPNTAADLVGAGACSRQAVKVWPKAVDCELFSPARASPEMRRRLEGSSAERGDCNGARADTSSSGPLLLYVGRVSPEKNLQLLRAVLVRLPGARLAVVGDGPAMADMAAHFRGTPTAFLGVLRGRELAAAYASADVFVMPSESETLGNVVGEAMASGLPVVAAAAGGVPSVIGRPGETGVLFPPGDASAAAAAIRRLMADHKARLRMSRAARAEMERWSWSHATREILQHHYPQAMAANNSRQGPGLGLRVSPFLA